ncbi:MAG: hypothetical protein JST00_35470 [Deltaproteobacteria bacterium]|nr:hypothetical protein [Deltaproteobacteria bacterium]
MGGEGRRAIGLVAIAYAAITALVVLQTAVLRAIPYDSSSFGVLVTSFRIAFFAADLVLFTACIALAKRHAPAKPFASAAVATSAISVLAGVVGLSARSFGAHRAFDSFAVAAGAAESWIAVGTSVLVLLSLRAALGASSREEVPTPRAVLGATVAFFVAAALWAALSVARMTSRELHSVTFAWLVWGVEIAKVGALASCGVFALRAQPTKAAKDDAATAPYRGRESAREGGASEEADAESVALRPPDPATLEPLQRALGGVNLYRIGFWSRLAVAVVLTVVSVIAASGLWLVLVLVPAGGAATALVMLLGLRRQMVLPSLRSGRRLALAMAPLGLAGLVDGLTALAILGAGVSMSGWRAQDTATWLWAMAYPTSALLAWLSIALLAGATAHAGRTLGRDVLVRRAQSVQALAVVVVTLAPAILVAAGSASRGDGAVFVALGLSLVLIVATIAFFVVQLLAQIELARALRDRLFMVR